MRAACGPRERSSGRVRKTSRSGCWRRNCNRITRRSRGSVERHHDAIASLFSEVLTLCARSGLASVGVIAVDGTKLPGNASRNANVDYEQLAREILEEAKAVDAAEDELYGDARGDELPEQLRTGEGRRAWLREAKRQLEEQRAKEARPVPRSRGKRLNGVGPVSRTPDRLRRQAQQEGCPTCPRPD